MGTRATDRWWGPLATRLMTFVVAGMAVIACAPASSAPPQPVPATASLDPTVMKADLDFVLRTLLEVHPATVSAQARAELEEAAAGLEAALDGPRSASEHFADAARLVASLGDAHTRLVFAADRYLNVRLSWFADGLAVTAYAGDAGVEPGDEVIAIGGEAPRKLLSRLRPLIPADNPQWLRFMAAGYLTREAPLRALGLVDEGGGVTFLLRSAGGETREARLEFSSSRPGPADERPYFGWWVSGDHGWFWLDECKDTPEYRSALNEFFAAVARQGVRTVVLDLRRNGGGQSSVEAPLLTYLPARVLSAYRVEARASRQALPWFGPGAELTQWFRNLFWDGKRSVPEPTDPHLVFHGEVVVAIGPNTFSAATDLATLLSDNGLASLVGEASGGAPSSYGDVLRFETPSGALAFGVSFKRFTRPDSSLDPAAELTPDVELPMTLEDLRAGEDPVLRWLEERP